MWDSLKIITVLKMSILLILTVLLTTLFVSSSILFFIGMAPTLCAALIDKSKNKPTTVCVGFLNFAALYPYLLTLFIRHHNSPEYLVELVFEPINIVFIYVCALLGYVLQQAIIKLGTGQTPPNPEFKVRDPSRKQLRRFHKYRGVAAYFSAFIASLFILGTTFVFFSGGNVIPSLLNVIK